MATLAELSKGYDLSLIRYGGFRDLLRLAYDEGLLVEALQDAGIDPQSLGERQPKLRLAMDQVLGRLKAGFRRETRLTARQ